MQWCGSEFGQLFDPLVEFAYEPPDRLSPPRPTLLFLPGIQTDPLTGFSQYPFLGAQYDLQIFAPDLDSERFANDHDGFVTKVSEHVKEIHRSGRQVYLMGESMGGVEALAVAVQLRQEHSAALSGLVLVNPATSFCWLPLRKWIHYHIHGHTHHLPQRLCDLLISLALAQRLFDWGGIERVMKGMWEGELARMTPALAAYFKAIVLASMLDLTFGMPSFSFLRKRMQVLEQAADDVNRALEAHGGAAVGVPLLFVAGTADRLVHSVDEASRLQRMLGKDACEVHLNPGSGHALTLDRRLDLTDVMGKWRSSRRT